MANGQISLELREIFRVVANVVTKILEIVLRIIH